MWTDTIIGSVTATTHQECSKSKARPHKFVKKKCVSLRLLFLNVKYKRSYTFVILHLFFVNSVQVSYVSFMIRYWACDIFAITLCTLQIIREAIHLFFIFFIWHIVPIRFPITLDNSVVLYFIWFFIMLQCQILFFSPLSINETYSRG